MAYVIMLTINLSTILNGIFIVFLWSKIYSNELIKYEPPPVAYATATAPLKLT